MHRIIQTPADIDRLIETLKKALTKGHLIVEIQAFKGPVQDNQRAYYWGVVIPTLCRHVKTMGNDISFQDMHTILKMSFCNKEVALPNGKTKVIPKSIGENGSADREEMSLFLNKVKWWASEKLGLEIPEPEEIKQ